eukprot:1180532-Prorocentrum_minimum.AAC.2
MRQVGVRPGGRRRRRQHHLVREPVAVVVRALGQKLAELADRRVRLGVVSVRFLAARLVLRVAVRLKVGSPAVAGGGAVVTRGVGRDHRAPREGRPRKAYPLEGDGGGAVEREGVVFGAGDGRARHEGGSPRHRVVAHHLLRIGGTKDGSRL